MHIFLNMCKNTSNKNVFMLDREKNRPVHWDYYTWDCNSSTLCYSGNFWISLSLCTSAFKQIPSINKEWGRGGSKQSVTNKGVKVFKLLKTVVFLSQLRSEICIRCRTTNRRINNIFVVNSRQINISSDYFPISQEVNIHWSNLATSVPVMLYQRTLQIKWSCVTEMTNLIVLMTSHLTWMFCDIYMKQTKCLAVYHVQTMVQTKTGNHPLLCTQRVKVKFHNTSETGLMEELVHGLCSVGKKRTWKEV